VTWPASLLDLLDQLGTREDELRPLASISGHSRLLANISVCVASQEELPASRSRETGTRANKLSSTVSGISWLEVRSPEADPKVVVVEGRPAIFLVGTRRSLSGNSFRDHTAQQSIELSSFEVSTELSPAFYDQILRFVREYYLRVRPEVFGEVRLGEISGAPALAFSMHGPGGEWRIDATVQAGDPLRVHLSQSDAFRKKR